jgi:integrase/recombinase XerD
MPKTRLKLNGVSGLTPSSLLDHAKEDIITVEDFILLHEKFIVDKSLEGLSERTLNDHTKHMNFFKDFLNTIQWSDIDHYPIDREIFKQYIYYMMQEKLYKPCTINIRLSSIKCYLKWLFDNKHMKENYALVLKKVKVPEDTIKPLNDSDIKKMLAIPDRTTYFGFRDFTSMIVILDCGVRAKELCSITPEDVDLKEGFIYIKAKNAKTRKYRELPINKQSCQLLKQLIDIAKENNCEYVFNSSFTSERLNELVLSKNYMKYGKRAGLTVKCTPYVFRHTYCTNAVKAGIDLFTIQRIMGHNSLVTTRRYVQLETSDLKKNHSKHNLIDKYFK